MKFHEALEAGAHARPPCYGHLFHRPIFGTQTIHSCLVGAAMEGLLDISHEKLMYVTETGWFDKRVRGLTNWWYDQLRQEYPWLMRPFSPAMVEAIREEIAQTHPLSDPLLNRMHTHTSLYVMRKTHDKGYLPRLVWATLLKENGYH